MMRLRFRLVSKLQLYMILMVQVSVCLQLNPLGVVKHGIIDVFGGYTEKESRSLSLTIKGLDAVNQLLKGATRVPSLWQSTKMRRYMKFGDRDTALKDFRSVHPINVKESISMVDEAFTIKPGKVIDGQVGDRYLRLRPSGDKWSDGHPTLDIIDVKTPGVPSVDQIVYSYKAVNN